MMNGRIVERVYLAAGPTDLRKSIDGLAVIVQELFHLDPFSKALFVFCNRLLYSSEEIEKCLVKSEVDFARHFLL